MPFKIKTNMFVVVKPNMFFLEQPKVEYYCYCWSNKHPSLALELLTLRARTRGLLVIYFELSQQQ